jgi:hypothetical protein
VTTLPGLLRRSDELEDEILAILKSTPESPGELSARMDAAAGLAGAAIEHGQSIRVLVGASLVTSAICLMRPQFEALTRSVWAMYAASDTEIERMQAHLTLESEKKAGKLPMLSKMLTEISEKAPAGPAQMLASFKESSLVSLNSYVHGGLHVLHRQAEGYPEALVLQILRNSNGLQTMAGMLLAMLSGSQATASRMSKIQPAFADCLPELVRG